MPPLVMPPLVMIDAPAPEFQARSTMGLRNLADYRGSWLVLFAHPADFTPVCTSEFIALSRAYGAFRAAGCDLLGLSVDSLSAHIAWVGSIRERFGVVVPFPIIEDPSMAVARAYGMLAPDAPSSATIRASFVIDPHGIMRAISWYPMNVGRNIGELLRLVMALQTADRDGVLLPADWQPGDPVLVPPPMQANGADAAAAPGCDGSDWYYRLAAANV